MIQAHRALACRKRKETNPENNRIGAGVPCLASYTPLSDLGPSVFMPSSSGTQSDVLRLKAWLHSATAKPGPTSDDRVAH